MKNSHKNPPLNTRMNLLNHDIHRLLFRITHRKTFIKQQLKRSQSSDMYTFKSFDETRSIFVHIPKTAGLSVCSSLYGNRAGGHTKLKEYANIFSSRDFYSYFKFSFVRNPWDRLHSTYNFLKSGGISPKDLAWSQKHLANINSFQDFVLNWLSEDKLHSIVHLIPQTEFLSLNKNSDTPLDYLGYFENLDYDFMEICKRVTPKSKLDHINRSKQDPNKAYTKEYNEEMIKKVNSLYQRDIELLDYTFDNSNSQQYKNKLQQY